MMATGYTIAGILLGTTVLVAGGIVGALWFAVHATRPELLDRRRRRDRR
jgi:hypothetical protein